MRQFSRALGVAGLAAAAFACVGTAQAEEIVITVTRVKALDKIDAASKADFLARVTIGGVPLTTDVVRNQDDIKPNWVIKKAVGPGVHDVKIELLDKDITRNDFVDINRVSKKRDLDFKVDTAKCRVTGFSSRYSCKDTITRSGNEPKKAEISFTVNVTK
jgi:hypothetical protein